MERARVVSEGGERRKGRGEEAEHLPSRKVRSSLPKLELGLRARVGLFRRVQWLAPKEPGKWVYSKDSRTVV